MKFVFMCLALLLSGVTVAAENSISADCATHARERYLVRGDWDAEDGGARLWNFKKLERTFNDEQAGRCDQQAFNQALGDSEEYWLRISAKYECPQEGRRVCASADENLDYIALARQVYTDKLDEVNEDQLTCTQPEVFPPRSPGRLLVQDVAPIIRETVQTVTPDPCEVVPSNWRRVGGANSSALGNVGTCLQEAVRGFIRNIRDLFTGLWDALQMGYRLAQRFGQQMVSFFRAAWNGTLSTFWAENAANGSALLRRMASALGAIPGAIANMARSKYQQWQCLNTTGRTAYVCRAVGYVGPEVVLAFLTGGATTSTRLLSRAVRPVDRVLRLAPPPPPRRIVTRTVVTPDPPPVRRVREARPTVRPPKDELRGRLAEGQRLPSDILRGQDVNALSQEQARALVEQIAGGTDRSATRRFVGRVHPDRAGIDGAQELRDLMNTETQLFNQLIDQAGLR